MLDLNSPYSSDSGQKSNTVLNSGNRAPFADTSFGAKFKNLKSRNLIVRKFLIFIRKDCSLNTIETSWRYKIKLKKVWFPRFRRLE